MSTVQRDVRSLNSPMVLVLSLFLVSLSQLFPGQTLDITEGSFTVITRSSQAPASVMVASLSLSSSARPEPPTASHSSQKSKLSAGGNKT